jgi:translocator protein
MPTWYDKLKKPSFAPPKKVFGPAWAVLYLFIISALITYFLTPVKPHPLPVGIILVIHFTASFSWTELFFTRKKILLAFFDILVIDTTLIALIALFMQANPLSGFLLLPYLGWGVFAAALNWSIYRLNPGAGSDES